MINEPESPCQSESNYGNDMECGAAKTKHHKELPKDGNFSLRFGTTEEGQKLFCELLAQTENANFEKPTPYLKKLIRRVQEITQGQPFDIRRLEYRQDGDLTSGRSK